MIAEIIIDELNLSCIIGCMKSERHNKQPLILSLAIKYNIKKAAQTDQIENALNYADIGQKLKHKIETSSFHLLEALSEKIISELFNYDEIIQVSLFLYKPNALSFAKRVGIKRTETKATYSPPSVNPKDQKLQWD